MRSLIRKRIDAIRISLLVGVVAFAAPHTIVAQEQETQPNVVLSVAKSVLFDPTTYVPATLSYTSQRMDWNTSQVLFRAGWVEHNSRFTLSGRPDDTPISYDAGNSQIRRAALIHLQESIVNNVAAQIFERALIQQHPEHRKLFKTLSWIERISFSSYVGYLASVDHFRQVQRNQELARLHGLK
jgi:hypothetical protein